MFSSMLLDTLNYFFFSLSRRSWAALSSLIRINPKAKIRQDVTSSWTLAIQLLTFYSLTSVCSAQKKKKKKSLPTANPLLQSWWIPHNCNQSWRSLINATGKQRSKPGKLKTSQYLESNHTLIKLHFHRSVLPRFPMFFVSQQQADGQTDCLYIHWMKKKKTSFIYLWT